MLKSQTFMNASDLTKYVNDTGNSVGTVVSIVYDASSGKYVLFYN